MLGRRARRGIYQELLSSGETWTFAVGTLLIPLSFLLRSLRPDWESRGWFNVPNSLLLASAAINGVPVIIGAVRGLIRRELNVDELVAIALTACLATGEWFEAATVAAIMKLGSLVEEAVSSRARDSIASLVGLNPDTVTLRNPDGSNRSVPRTEVRPGDLAEFRPGEVIAVDGIIREGRAGIDESSLTGEGIPVNRREGQEVHAGTVNLDGLLVVEATRGGEDTTLSRIIALVQAAEESKVAGTRLVDRYAAFFTPAVVAIAALAWAITGEWERAVTVLIVGCPCSFLLSGPIPTAAAIGRAASLGIMVKNGQALEEIARAGEWYFDKTGTLTPGTPVLRDITPLNGIPADTLASLAAAVETGSEHPLGRAVLAHARERNLTVPAAKEIRALPGQGIQGIVDGVLVELDREDSAGHGEGGSPVGIRVDGRREGILVFHDPERKEARTLVQNLRNDGASRIGMLSGDHSGVVDRMKAALGLDEAQGRMSPAGKRDHLLARQKDGARVVFVGDGLNDAPALGTARVGIAMGERGVDAALETADVVLLHSRIGLLAFLRRMGRRMDRIIRSNIILSFSINAVSLVLAFSGILTPVLGAVSHNIGSILVVGISATLGFMRPREGEDTHGS